MLDSICKLKYPALKWAIQITGKLINLALKWIISTALKCQNVLLNLALKCPAPVVVPAALSPKKHNNLNKNQLNR